MSTKLDYSGTYLTGIGPYLNEKGGLMMQVINKTGGASVKGHIYNLSGANDFAAIKTVVAYAGSVLVCWEAGVADGDWMWCVYCGPAQVYLSAAGTRGQMVRACLAADGTKADGTANTSAWPTASPQNTDATGIAIGSALETTSGAGLCWTLVAK